MAQDQLNEIRELVALWFLESDEGARDFLRAIAEMWREELAKVTPKEVTT